MRASGRDKPETSGTRNSRTARHDYRGVCDRSHSGVSSATVIASPCGHGLAVRAAPQPPYRYLGSHSVMPGHIYMMTMQMITMNM
jgi:hypothetical protein